METLTLNDGTVFAGHCHESGGILWFYLDNSTLTEAFAAWNDPQKTNKIVYDQYGTKITITGYNHLRSISEETGTMISGGLMKQ